MAVFRDSAPDPDCPALDGPGAPLFPALLLLAPAMAFALFGGLSAGGMEAGAAMLWAWFGTNVAALAGGAVQLLRGG
ncbi:MAG: hypothetical protein KatS3mg118_3626 [Paracoccaceae bacterium]|nr:MAG: hypothetical protein KatS3mg118_3626 [Paracoccaceae bacterium]